MTVNIDRITSTNWSPLLGSSGEIVLDSFDIEQCIDIILTTRKGSDPHRPLFGCDAWLWIDSPASIAIPNIVREVVDALELWEPRIVVTGVTAAIASDGQVTVTVAWRPRDSATIMIKEVSIGNVA